MMSVTQKYPLIQRCRFALAYELGILLVISPAFIKHWHELFGFDGKIIALLLIAIIWNSVFSNLFNLFLKRFDSINIRSKNYRALYTSCYLVCLTGISLPIFYTLIPLKVPQHIIASFGFSVLAYLYAFSTNTLYRKHLS
ncbi:hypothetical protein VITU102760_04120 [Vibrio tubiashii]|uniref:Chlorhexidine efflux transporter domain-containing protein n=1 Tax=Vibrio tubiashii ATCC 19109 TaxID=1051646 RepID=F9T6E8_9VIBR|nr:hypothetical protein [Vibrio tubiashii]AIW16699.1 hypothetical protein IX91_21710 [Vibrio tubiashii ATCC 19109]EGU54611.1 hypothetical protein VITU9109_13676 [Vibrio tubiashii ATCC 19109]EIF02045.1 hypothetical protein VT1337_19977 [Vibrio tubiashii NCIMB 1337 = ATCC 19106]